MVLTQDPQVCDRGYESTDTRPPQDGSNKPMNRTRTAPSRRRRATPEAPRTPRAAGAAYRAPVVASYDPATGRLPGVSKVDPALSLARHAGTRNPWRGVVEVAVPPAPDRTQE